MMLTFQMILIDDIEISDDSDEKENYDEEDSDKQNYSKK